MKAAAVLTLLALLAGCTERAGNRPQELANAPPAKPAAVGFINKVWQVSESSSVARGTLYVFLGEGTLIVTARGGTPMVGRWTLDHGQLTMVEEGIAYPTDILSQTSDRLAVRSHNPGQVVDITLTQAPSG